jgi:hypothetical protein
LERTTVRFGLRSQSPLQCDVFTVERVGGRNFTCRVPVRSAGALYIHVAEMYYGPDSQ